MPYQHHGWRIDGPLLRGPNFTHLNNIGTYHRQIKQKGPKGHISYNTGIK